MMGFRFTSPKIDFKNGRARISIDFDALEDDVKRTQEILDAGKEAANMFIDESKGDFSDLMGLKDIALAAFNTYKEKLGYNRIWYDELYPLENGQTVEDFERKRNTHRKEDL